MCNNKLPTDIYNIILDKYLNIQVYWKNYFTKNILSIINAKTIHQECFKHIHFELKTFCIKKELTSYSVNGMLFSFDKSPCEISFDDNMWIILYEGSKYITSPSEKEQRITLLFEKYNYNRYMMQPYTIMESSGIFPYIDDGDYGYEDLGREYIQNYKNFINKFMNAIFTNRTIVKRLT